MTCLPCKEEIDNGMGAEAARFYAAIMNETSGVSAAQRHVPLFYAAVVENVFGPVAQRLLGLKLTKEQDERLMAQIDKQCYRANDLRAWALAADTVRAERAAAWTAKIIEWLDEDQVFYTALSAEAGEKPKRE
jgi:hypothetical protein